MLERNFQTKGYEDLELSTQILIDRAIKRGIKVEVLDRAQQFLKLSLNGKHEIVKDATRTSKDSYICSLILENKHVQKQIMLEAGIPVPEARAYDNKKDAMQDALAGQICVVKPKNTNFGIGVSVLKKGDDFEKAVDGAFKEDTSILVESFLTGEEFRFLVIDQKCIAVLNRIPANIKGDGKSSITELIAQKNINPWRGIGHVSPLEKINLGETEIAELQKQNLNANEIPKKDQIIYLRKNSNISTGGDSIDMTDEIHSDYKEIAINAAKSVDAAICGVDMIIENHKVPATKSPHGIIELNFNPVLYFHHFPFIGKERPAAEAVLDLLFKT